MIKLKKSQKITNFEKGPIRRSLFTNGSVSLFHQFKGMQSATVSLYYLTGSTSEKKNQYGATHLLEHMLFKEGGGENPKLKYLELRGAELNAYTYKEYTCFEMDCSSEKLEHFLPIFLELFFNLVMDEKEFKTEKGVVIQEIKDEEDDHESWGYGYLLEKNFGAKLGHDIAGDVKTVKEMTSKRLIKYFEKHFTADKLILSISSGKPFRKLERIFLEEQNKIDRFHIPQNPYRLGKKNSFGKIKKHSKTLHRKLDNTIYYLGMNGVTLESDYFYDLMVLDELFFEGLTSKFYVELREKTGLLYGLGSSINSFVDNGSYNFIFNCQKSKLKAVKKKTKEILDYYLENEFDNEEVEFIKDRLIDAWKLSYDSMVARSEHIAINEIYGETNHGLTHLEKKVKRVTPKRLKYLLNTLTQKGYSEVTLLPRKEKSA